MVSSRSFVSVGLVWGSSLVAACGTAELAEDPTLGGAGASESFDRPYDVTPIQLAQTEDMTIAPRLSVGCSDINGTKENSWYRIFSLAEEGIEGPFTVHRVNFGVQTAIGETRVKVSLGTYAGEYGTVQLDPAKIDVLALTTVAVPEDSDGRILQATFAGIEVPRGANLIVEIRSEDLGDGRYFYLGATQSAETIPGYLRAPTCNAPNPIMVNSIGYGLSHLVLTVSGTY